MTGRTSPGLQLADCWRQTCQARNGCFATAEAAGNRYEPWPSLKARFKIATGEWQFCTLQEINYALFRPGPHELDRKILRCQTQRCAGHIRTRLRQLGDQRFQISRRCLRRRRNRAIRRDRAIRDYPLRIGRDALGRRSCCQCRRSSPGLCALPNAVLCRGGRRRQRPEGNGKLLARRRSGIRRIAHPKITGFRCRLVSE